MKDKAFQETHQELILIGRFISTFAGAFRAFFIYKKDNKAIDEIISNVAKRYQLVANTHPEIRLGISNLSFTYESNPVVFKDVTSHITLALRNLGFK